MNIEYILMMSFYTLKSIVAFKSENSRKIVRDVPVCTAKLKIGNRTYKYRQWFPIHIYYRNTFHGNIYGLLKWKKKYYTVGTIPQSNIKIVERGQMYIPVIHK
jgi:hypothetical protein